jgi:hypothetical protein
MAGQRGFYRFDRDCERLVGKSYKDGAPEVSQFIINPRWNGRIQGALHETILLQTFQRGPIQAAGEETIMR